MDTGANNFQNFPHLIWAKLSKGLFRIHGHGVIDTKNQFEAASGTGECNVILGDHITATATEMISDGNGGYKPGSTSEFSNSIPVTK